MSARCISPKASSIASSAWGSIQISTAGDEPEFTIADMPDPYVIQEAIAKAQDMHDDKD